MELLPQSPGPQLNVLDPMCGSGTVLGVATSRGHRAIGVDIDPLAVLMSDVATRPVETKRVEEVGRAVSTSARSQSSVAMPWPRSDVETRRFAQYWFDDRQRVSLARLARAIREVDDRAVRQVLQLALSRIIVTKSPRASLAADTAHSRPHRVLVSSDYSIVDGFDRSVKEVVRILEKRRLAGDVSVSLGDSRNLAGIADATVDWTISSPPYLNAIDYLRGHKMSLIWMGYSIAQLRSIRSASIGAERAPDDILSSRAQAMVDTVRADAVDELNLPTRTLSRYAVDLCEFSDEIWRVSKPGARAVLVVGNSSLRGNYIRNDSLTTQAMTASGFTFESMSTRDLPENRRYLPVRSPNASAMEKRMRAESVIAFSKLA